MQAPFADPLSGIELLASPLPLVGREGEMRVMCALLDTVALQKPAGARALMLSGDVGVGKSRLLAEMCSEARSRDFRVLDGRTYEAGALFPYLPFIEALRPVIRSSDSEALRYLVGLEKRGHRIVDADPTAASISLVGAPLVAALARLFPELPHLLEIALTPEILTPDQEKFRLFDAVATFLERMASERPVMLAIDNLQWADSASLELTMYLTVRLHGSPVALVGVTRPPGSSRAAAEGEDAETARQNSTTLRVLGELMRQGLLLFLPVHPLSADAAERHLRMLLPGGIGNARSLLARAEGNPFFLEELVRMLTLNGQLVQRDGAWHLSRATAPELPESISLAVEQRLQGLGALCLELLRVAALFGRAFPLQALVVVLRESEAKVQAVIDEAVQASVIARSPGATSTFGEEQVDEVADHQILTRSPSYMFCQGIVQEVLSNQLPAHQARTLHGMIGATLERYYGAQTPAAELARHYVLGGEREAALRWSLLAGEHAARQQAHREAIGHFRVALKMLDAQTSLSDGQTLPSPAQLHISIGESWFKLGELGQAATAFQQALEELQRARESTRAPQPPILLAAQANRLLADAYRMQGKYELALAHLQAARNALDAGADTDLYREDAPHVSWISSRRSSPGAPVLQQVGVAERILLLQAQATMEMLFNRAEEAEQALWQSHQLATEMGDRGSQAFALHLIGWIRGWGVHIHEAIRLQEQAHELYVTIGDPFRAALGDQGLGIIYQALGEMEKARLHNLRGFELARRYGVRHVLGWLHWNQGAMALAEGNWTGCESHLQQAMQEAEATSNARLKPLVIQCQAELAFRRGDWHEAEQLFQAALSAAVNTEWYPGTVALYGHFLAVTGRSAAAKVQLELAAGLPEPIGYSGHFYIPLLAEGFLHLGKHGQATSYSERIQQQRGLMYYGIAVDRILGEVAALEGDWETAERAFEEGLALCRRVHNQPEEAAILYEQARSALMRTSGENEPMRYSLEHIHALCNEARALFLHHEMSRAAAMVDTLQEGIRQLDARDREAPSRKITLEHGVHGDYRLDLHMTRRELEVLRLVAEGHTDREVAEMLVISPRTVNRHLSNVFVKLDVPGRAAAVAYAIRQGLVG